MIDWPASPRPVRAVCPDHLRAGSGQSGGPPRLPTASSLGSETGEKRVRSFHPFVLFAIFLKDVLFFKTYFLKEERKQYRQASPCP